MIDPVAIRLHDIGKQYQIGSREAYQTLRESLIEGFYAPLRRLSSAFRNSPSDAPSGGEYIWALKHISLEIQRGEVVGVIGRNGAGKTTLLKILSRITEPTAGFAEINGRVVSLLEVGTGFHAELTGRENIFLNGAILGMRRAEIQRKFDDIVSFAEVEAFLDTPVKRYSSGMYMRLAFAVAAHLEPEILLVDEVLAVGDAAFQKKCLGKMGDVAKTGRTVLFVSHNMGAIRQLCPVSLWLDNGAVREFGDTGKIIDRYLQASEAGAEHGSAVFAEDADKASQLAAVRLLNERGEVTPSFSCDSPVNMELTYEVRRPLKGLYACVEIVREDGTLVLVSYSYDVVPNPLEHLGVGTHVFNLTIPPRTLAHGKYYVHFSTAAGLSGSTAVDSCGRVCSFTLDDLSSLKGNRRLGYLSTLLEWNVAVRL